MRVRPSSRLLLLGLLLAGVIGSTGPAAAQGLFEQFFGFVSPKPVAPPFPLPHSSAPAGVFGGPSQKGASDGRPAEMSGGTFRTVCVRMCDGFYVPVSYATRRENFHQDENKCRSTCGGDAQLFYHRNPGGAMEDAVDLSGRAYSRLPNAFRFRKVRVEGCACRPPPWSEAELARHQSYAVAAVTPAAPGQSIASATSMAPEQPADKQTARKLALASLGGADKPTSSGTEKASRKTVTANSKAPSHTAPRPGTAVVAAVPHKVAQTPALLFGGSNGGVMGLSGKPKYTWPGD